MNFVVLFAIVVITIESIHCEDVYKTKFDNIDIEAIIKNDRLLQNHFNCLLEGKACTPEDEELRKKMPEIFETCCAKCTDKHKESAKKMTKYLLDNKPELIKKLISKYDPDRKFIEKCADQLKAEGIDISQF